MIIGYLLIPDGPIDIDYSNIVLSDNNFGRDVFHDKPVIGREIDLTSSENFTADERIMMLTSIVVRYIEYNRIPGELVFMYEILTEGWDKRLVLKAYKR